MKRLAAILICFCLFINSSNAKSRDTLAHCDIYTFVNQEMESAIDSIVQKWKNCRYYQQFHTFPMLLIQIYDEGCDMEIYPYSKTIYDRFSIDNRINCFGFVMSEEVLIVIHDFSESQIINNFFTCTEKDQSIHPPANYNLIDHYFPPFNAYFDAQYEIDNDHLLNGDCVQCTDEENSFEFAYLVNIGDTWETIAENLNIDSTKLKRSYQELNYKNLTSGFLTHFVYRVKDNDYGIFVAN